MKTLTTILLVLALTLPLYSQSKVNSDIVVTETLEQVKAKCVSLEKQVKQLGEEGQIYKKLLLKTLLEGVDVNNFILETYLGLQVSKEQLKNASEIISALNKAKTDEDAIEIMKRYKIRK